MSHLPGAPPLQARSYTHELYQWVIEDVINKCRGDFVQEGKEDILILLQEMWEEKVTELGFTQPPSKSYRPKAPEAGAGAGAGAGPSVAPTPAVPQGLYAQGHVYPDQMYSGAYQGVYGYPTGAQEPVPASFQADPLYAEAPAAVAGAENEPYEGGEGEEEDFDAAFERDLEGGGEEAAAAPPAAPQAKPKRTHRALDDEELSDLTDSSGDEDAGADEEKNWPDGIMCLFEKVGKRKAAKQICWRNTLKGGIMKLGDVELAFREGLVELSWASGGSKGADSDPEEGAPRTKKARRKAEQAAKAVTAKKAQLRAQLEARARQLELEAPAYETIETVLRQMSIQTYEVTLRTEALKYGPKAAAVLTSWLDKLHKYKEFARQREIVRRELRAAAAAAPAPGQ